MASSFYAFRNNVFNGLFTKKRVKFIEIREPIIMFLFVMKVESAVPVIAILEK